METATLVMDHHPRHSSWTTSHDPNWHLTPPVRHPPQHQRVSPPVPGPRMPANGSGLQHRHRSEISADLRYQVATRLVRVNFEHCRTAWKRRRSDPIGPHVTIYL